MTSLELKAYRKTHALSQAALALELGVSRRTVAAWETDRKAPSFLGLALETLTQRIRGRKAFEQLGV